MPSRERTDTARSLERLENTLKWHNSIGRGMFAIGLVLIGLSISTLVYFGRLDERVRNVQTYTTVLDTRETTESIKVQGQILRIQARLRTGGH